MPNNLNQQSRLLAVVGIRGFVRQLSFLHQRDTDTKEQSGHGNRSQNEPIEAVDSGVHDPYSPPELNLSEVVRMSSSFPESDIADLSRVRCAEIVALLVGNQLYGGGGEADKAAY